MKLGVGALYKNSAEFEFRVIAPSGAHPPKMWRCVTTLGKSAQAVYSLNIILTNYKTSL